MKHYIDAEPGSDEFRELFREIRDEFVSRLQKHIENRLVSSFRVCDSEGVPDKHPFDTLKEAKQFMEFMIDEGFYFAFMGVNTDQGLEVWLTKWEEPEVGPKWPSGFTPLFEELHEGVFIKSESSQQT